MIVHTILNDSSINSIRNLVSSVIVITLPKKSTKIDNAVHITFGCTSAIRSTLTALNQKKIGYKVSSLYKPAVTPSLNSLTLAVTIFLLALYWT